MRGRVGSILLYRLTELQVQMVNQRRADFTKNKARAAKERPGWQAHFGSVIITPGEKLPLIVTKGRVNAFGDREVSGQVILDGNDTLWVEGVREGYNLGEWSAE